MILGFPFPDQRKKLRRNLPIVSIGKELYFWTPKSLALKLTQW